MIVFIILYIIVWIVVTGLFYKIRKVNLQQFDKNTILFWILYFSAMICFFLCVFYSPWNHGLKKVIDDAKKKYDSLKADTESNYQNQIKAFWVDALNEQNRYYFFSLMTLTLLPFFYFFFFMISNTVEEINTFIHNSLTFILLTISIFYTAIILLLYTITSKKWTSMMIPITFIVFLISILYFQISIPFFHALGFMSLCFIECMLLLSNVAFFWTLIPLAPFYFALFMYYINRN